MTEPLDALLEQFTESSVRVAIRSGWELGSGLSSDTITEKQTRKELERAAEILSRKMGLDLCLIQGSALLAMSLTNKNHVD